MKPVNLLSIEAGFELLTTKGADQAFLVRPSTGHCPTVTIYLSDIVILLAAAVVAVPLLRAKGDSSEIERLLQRFCRDYYASIGSAGS